MDLTKVDAFTAGYVECMLWSENDQSDPETGGDPIDDNYGPEDIDGLSEKAIITDCEQFQKTNAELLAQAYALKPGYDASHAGHDFWLTRRGHGAGFWDRGLGEVGEALTKASKKYHDVYPYVENGKVFLDRA